MNTCTLLIDSYVAAVFRCCKNTPDAHFISENMLDHIKVLFTMGLVINAGHITHPLIDEPVILKLTPLGKLSHWVSDPQGHKIIIPIGE